MLGPNIVLQEGPKFVLKNAAIILDVSTTVMGFKQHQFPPLRAKADIMFWGNLFLCFPDPNHVPCRHSVTTRNAVLKIKENILSPCLSKATQKTTCSICFSLRRQESPPPHSTFPSRKGLPLTFKTAFPTAAV